MGGLSVYSAKVTPSRGTVIETVVIDTAMWMENDTVAVPVTGNVTENVTKIVTTATDTVGTEVAKSIEKTSQIEIGVGIGIAMGEIGNVGTAVEIEDNHIDRVQYTMNISELLSR